MCQTNGPELSVAARQNQVQQLRTKGASQSEIAQVLGVSQATISRDIAVVEEQLRTESVRDLELIREKELRKLDLIEREAWIAWDRSMEAGPRNQTGNGAETNLPAGNPRYLAIIQKCMTMRHALLQLNKPQKNTVRQESPVRDEEPTSRREPSQGMDTARQEAILERIKATPLDTNEEAAATASQASFGDNEPLVSQISTADELEKDLRALLAEYEPPADAKLAHEADDGVIPENQFLWMRGPQPAPGVGDGMLRPSDDGGREDKPSGASSGVPAGRREAQFVKKTS